MRVWGLILVLLQACTAGSPISSTTQATATTLDRPASSSVPPAATSTTLQPADPMRLSNEDGLVIEGVHISNPGGDCVQISRSSRVTIRNSIIGPCEGRGISIRDSTEIVIEGVEFIDSAAGVYALSSTALRVSDNTFESTGRNPIQFDKVTGAGNVIAGNLITNDHGNVQTEDSISVYQSEGTEDRPLLVERNVIRGGGSSPSGSGIMVGDNGGTNILVTRNLLIEPGQVGIGVAGGSRITVTENVVFGTRHDWTNVGLYVWNQHPGTCESIEVRGNVVEFYSSTGAPNPFFEGGNCGTVEGWDANEIGEGLSDELETLEKEILGS